MEFKQFFRDESGVAKVDWVVIAAGATAMGIMALDISFDEMGDYSWSVRENLQEGHYDTTWSNSLALDTPRGNGLPPGWTSGVEPIGGNESGGGTPTDPTPTDPTPTDPPPTDPPPTDPTPTDPTPTDPPPTDPTPTDPPPDGGSGSVPVVTSPYPDAVVMNLTRTITPGWSGRVSSEWLPPSELPVDMPASFEMIGDGDPTAQRTNGRQRSSGRIRWGTIIWADPPACGTSQTVTMVLNGGEALVNFTVTRPAWPQSWGVAPAGC